MALENLGGAWEAAERKSDISETAKLPERVETSSETSRLPERIDGIGEPSKRPGTAKDAGAVPESADVRDAVWKKVNDALSSPEGIQALMEKHPEKAELWQDDLKAIERAREVFNDPDTTEDERRSAQKRAQAHLSTLKGQLLETAVKDALTDAGLTVEAKQRTVDGQDGGTRPDVIAKNDTDRPIQAFGITVKPGETLSIECKCGQKDYLEPQLRSHIPNQLSGQIGHKALLTTADIRQVNPALVRDTCGQYGAALIVLDTRVSAVEKAIKEVSAL